MARARAVCVALVASTLAASTVLQGVPIGAANTTSLFVYLLSPPFALPGGPLTSATLWFAALGSPRKNPAGTTQAKLLGAAMVRVNGVLVTGGPGHNIPTNSTVVRGADVLPFLRFGGEPNVIGIASFYDRSQASGVPPRVQAWLNVTTAAGDEYTAAATGPAWLSWGADAYHQPTGDAGVSWYPMPNEFLDRRAYPAGWSEPGFAGGPSWESAVQAPAWDAPPYLEPRGAPVLLTRDACSVVHVSPTRQILDYGTEFMGGVNLTFVGAARGTTVTVVLAEELNPDGQSVRSPLRTGNKWNSTWTLAGGFADGGIVHHEFVQFRYVQVDGNVPPLAAGPGGGASAWNIIHPAGGLGVNVFDAPCAAATPAAAAWGAGAPAPSPLGSFSSSRPDLDRVWSFCASTIIATSLDVNVDGQTRERDVDIVDALNTARGQYSVFSPGDVVVPERTLREAFGNDTGQFSQWMDFKMSSALAAHDHALWTGDVASVNAFWGASDNSLRAIDSNYNALQFLAGVRYFNASGNNLFHFTASCGGAWACDPLVDWPVTCRDGFDVSAANSDDSVRSSLGALALDALADAAGWRGDAAGAARYGAAAAATRAALRALNFRVNATNSSEAYFVDGAVGPSAAHAAIHSSVYALAAGALDGDAPAIRLAVARMRRHGVAPSSSMMGRWWVDGLYRAGVWAGEAADLAFDVLTSPSYPSWLDMLAQGATTTMEAWRAADKANLDFAHPWASSPSFTIPAGTLGVVPTAPGWARWRAMPQPSGLTSMRAGVPTPAGVVSVSFSAAVGAADAVASLNVTVLGGQAAQACLPVPGAVGATPARAPASDVLTVDGAPVPAPAVLGRMLCTTADLLPGAHTVERRTVW